MVKNCLSRSCYSPAEFPLAMSVATSLMLCCAQPCQCVPGPLRAQLFKHFMVKSSSRDSLVHGWPTSSSKSASGTSVFNVWNSNRALAIQFCALFVDQRAQPRKQRPTSATPGATLPKKIQGFAPESVFTREFTRSRSVTPLYRSHTRTALANYVDDMMTKLPLDIRP